MNYWTSLSIEFANQRNYLDELFKVYPIVPGLIRDLNPEIKSSIEEAFNSQDKDRLLEILLSLELFPIKDSYVAYLKHDQTAIDRNPETVNRLYGRLVEVGLPDLLLRVTSPKETNRQIGPLFNRWLHLQTLGVELLPPHEFLTAEGNAVLDGNDRQLKEFAATNLNYQGEKGLDFVARFNGQYVVGEAKFLTDFGGHQNAQFADAITLLRDSTVNAVKIAILDGVPYISRSNDKMARYLRDHPEQYNIMSSLVLREFLYQL